MEKIEDKIHSTFSSIASAMGYSEVHGRIISVLLVEDAQLSLQELSKKTGYSSASVSISLDMLEIVGVVRKMKNAGDRKLYVKLEGDMLDALRKAFLFKLQKEIMSIQNEFEKYKKQDDRKTKKIVSVLEKEVKRFEEYLDRLSKVEIPK
jgi:DNA-binding transcriptional regulator GbsR (MarR family)